MFDLILFILLLLILFHIVFVSLVVGISPMPSSKIVNKKILEKVENTKDKKVIDLGSGFGSLAIFLAVNLPNREIVGYEISFFPYLVSLILKKLLNIKNLQFYRKNFLKEDLKNSTLVCYLFPKAMQDLEDKIFDETINTTIISNTFSFRNIKQRDIIVLDNLSKTPIYIYKT